MSLLIMTEELIKAKSYKNGEPNYVLKANLFNRWHALTKSIVDKLKNKFGENFNIVIFWNVEDKVEYYSVPYVMIKHLLTAEHLTLSENNISRWNFTIKNDMLCVHANMNFSVNIKSCFNGKILSVKEKNDERIITAVEGKELLVIHKTKERNSELINKFKEFKKECNPTLKCEICGFSFEEFYGAIGAGYIEAHHIKPLATLNMETTTTFDDLILVCSNCHKMLHRRICNKFTSIEELKRKINNA